MQVGTSPTIAFGASGLESLFYRHVLCLCEPALMLHRARCRWGSHLVITCGVLISSHFFYTPIFCVGEPVLLPHRARCRWGHRIPVMFLVLSRFFRHRSRGRWGPHLIIYLWRFGRRVSFFYTHVLCVCVVAS